MKKSATLFTAVLAAIVAAVAPGASRGEESEAVAIVAGRTITLADVEASIASQLASLETQRKTLIENAIGPLVDRALVEAEAEEQGITADRLISTEVTAKLPAVSDAEIDAWYEANKARLQPGMTKERVAGQIKQLLEQERQAAAYRDFLRTLTAKHDTKILFEPPRIEIDVTDATWKGAEDAPVTLVEFSDFECPACRGFNPVLSQLLERYPDQVRVAFLQFPLRSIHPQAQGAAEASLCARDGGKFWELHDEMFANQRNLGADALKAAARKVGLDGETFDECLDSERYADVVQADFERAAQAGATGTPAVYINGRVVSPGRVPSLDAMTSIVDDELRRAKAAGE